MEEGKRQAGPGASPVSAPQRCWWLRSTYFIKRLSLERPRRESEGQAVGSAHGHQAWQKALID